MTGSTDLLEEYRQYILSEELPEGKIEPSEGDIKLSGPYAQGEIRFHLLASVIVEMSVTSRARGESIFYLHFELKDMAHAKELWAEMREVFAGARDKGRRRILLCCTGGLTTGYFAQQLQEAAELLSLDYEFSAVPWAKLGTAGLEAEAVLLAPQIAYQYEAACTLLPEKLVLKIPAKIFARYDVAALLDFIWDGMDKWRQTSEDRAIAKALGEIKSRERILALVLMPFAGRTRIAYRLYEQGTPLKAETVIKGRLDVRKDIEDILDTAACRFGPYDIVGIATPGSVWQGHLDLDSTMIDPELDLAGYLEERYVVPAVITNNVNAAALGFYAQQDKYRNIVFLSLPRGYSICGMGLVLDGRLHQGSHNIAGEIKYLLYSLLPREEWYQHHLTDRKKSLETIEVSLRAALAMIDPELVCVRSELVTDMEALRQKLAAYIPEKYLPDLQHIRDDEMSELALLGQMILCLEKLADGEGCC